MAVTVRSAVTSLAMRSIVEVKITAHCSSASSLASFFSLLIKPSRSFLISRSVICINFSAALALVSFAIFSSLSCCFTRMSRISFLSASTSSSPLRKPSWRLSRSSIFLSSASWRDSKRCSNSFISLRRFCSSLRASSTRRSASSLAFCIVASASFLAFASAFLPSSARVSILRRL